MKGRVDRLEEEVREMNKVLIDTKGKTDRLHDWKGESNNLMQNIKGMIDVIKDSHKENIEVLREEMRSISKTLSSDISKLMSWKSMLIGGAGVGTTMIVGVYYIFKLYLDYKK